MNGVLVVVKVLKVRMRRIKISTKSRLSEVLISHWTLTMTSEGMLCRCHFPLVLQPTHATTDH